MKKLLLFVSVFALFCSTGKGVAQIAEGSTLVGGSLANAKLLFGSAGETSIRLTPKIGYFVQDNLAVGGEIMLEASKVKNIDAIYKYGIGAFGRYYLGENEKGLHSFLTYGRWFIEAGAGISGANGGALMFNVNFGPGYAYFLTNDIALETSLLYNGSFGGGNQNGLVFNLGFMIHLPSKRYVEMKNHRDSW